MRAITVGIITSTLLSGVAPAATAAPSAGPTEPGVPVAPEPPVPVVRRIDVDGDLRNDTVRFTRVGVTPDDYTFRLDVRTATGRRATRDITIANYFDGTLTPDDTWGGVAHLDGVRGAEINIEQSGNAGDYPWPHVYTWRAGRLVPAVAPDASPDDPAWRVADHWMIGGYAFSSSRGQRLVTSTQLQGSFTGPARTLRYRGTRTTYRWSAGTWKRVKVARTGTLNETSSVGYAGWSGITWR